MNILVTGASGFLGRNLIETLKTIRDGKNRTRPQLAIGEIFAFTRASSRDELDRYCRDCDFVFHLAGVNRPQDPAEFQRGNRDLAATLLDTLERHGNRAPLLFASSIQASLAGRFGTSAYGLSKKAGEELVFAHAERTGAPVYVYRFPNLAGKWIRPNYNSALGTFCHNIANDLPITVNDPSVELELLFIDDLLEELLDALEGHPHRCRYPAEGETVDGLRYDGLSPLWAEDGAFCAAPVTHRITLGRLVACLRQFHDQPATLLMPPLAPGSVEKKLYSMYLSYLPREKVCVALKSSRDQRGSFTELLKTADHGQFSVNVSLPGVTKGEHWHNSKWEIFIVVSGHGLIQERKIGSEEIMEFEVSGEKLQAVYMLPGYTHNLINLSRSEPLVTLMWANEIFDPARPDTFREPVQEMEG